MRGKIRRDLYTEERKIRRDFYFLKDGG